ncbi:hypothetical protein QL093DRAFT_2191402 [Fusarium oxysporum]|nr:hypothetical protein QL093DRAFT_2191402 [Fusarium oxysporum]
MSSSTSSWCACQHMEVRSRVQVWHPLGTMLLWWIGLSSTCTVPCIWWHGLETRPEARMRARTVVQERLRYRTYQVR